MVNWRSAQVAPSFGASSRSLGTFFPNRSTRGVLRFRDVFSAPRKTFLFQTGLPRKSPASGCLLGTSKLSFQTGPPGASKKSIFKNSQKMGFLIFCELGGGAIRTQRRATLRSSALRQVFDLFWAKKSRKIPFGGIFKNSSCQVWWALGGFRQ